ncbi:hypothetical protein BDP27DRAFT_1424207 [Rhodocollybia butyracea]|uniref:Uncharacterized protein n=1 Tax=Rhodocollybia butyracea TaxID=206335 RepID=A0A9P5PI32_9AGAR|nr:hypothetical protein BDP27DRAFT_1424207 [Rhodocollybia butyracea]
MTSFCSALVRWSLVAAVACWFFPSAQADFLEQSFSFSWDSQLAVPVPVTTQCQTLPITWARGTNTGPNPVAPYFLQIYTSAYVFPFVVAAGSDLSFDFTVPFGPGTLYQICMFDSNGNTGGCQAIYTVIANASSSPLSCSNSTLHFPLGPLDVEAEVPSGPLSQYGWPAVCSDITVTPKNGTGPYTFTIAPSSHPPLNITSQTTSPMTWKVSLTWASPFFISVADSAGNYWSGSDNLAGAVAGASVGGVVVGLLIGSFVAFFFLRKRMIRNGSYSPVSPTGMNHTYQPTLSRSLSGTEYRVEPFILPNSTGESGSDRGQGSDDRSKSQSVYVVHHDGGRAPVTVYHENGTEVVELPPRYIDGVAVRSPTDTNTSSSGNEPRTSDDQIPAFLQSQRRPQSAPQKARQIRLRPPSS